MKSRRRSGKARDGGVGSLAEGYIPFQLRDDSNKILILARVFLCVCCSQKTSPASGNLLRTRPRSRCSQSLMPDHELQPHERW